LGPPSVIRHHHRLSGSILASKSAHTLPYEIIWSQAVAIKVYNISSTRIAIDNHITRSTKSKEIALVSRFLKIIPYTYDRPFVTFTYFSEGIPARYKLKPFALLAFLGNSRKYRYLLAGEHRSWEQTCFALDGFTNRNEKHCEFGLRT
jgi:hypothetical protein